MTTPAELLERIEGLLQQLPADELDRLLESYRAPAWVIRDRRLNARDAAIRELRDILAPHGSPRAAAFVIAAALRRYAGGLWRTDRDSITPPVDAQRQRVLLHRVTMQSQGRALSERQVQRVLTGTRTPPGVPFSGNEMAHAPSDDRIPETDSRGQHDT